MSIISPTPQISKVPAFQWAHSGPLRTGSSSLDVVLGPIEVNISHNRHVFGIIKSFENGVENEAIVLQ